MFSWMWARLQKQEQGDGKRLDWSTQSSQCWDIQTSNHEEMDYSASCISQLRGFCYLYWRLSICKQSFQPPSHDFTFSRAQECLRVNDLVNSTRCLFFENTTNPKSAICIRASQPISVSFYLCWSFPPLVPKLGNDPHDDEFVASNSPLRPRIWCPFFEPGDWDQASWITHRRELSQRTSLSCLYGWWVQGMRPATATEKIRLEACGTPTSQVGDYASIVSSSSSSSTKIGRFDSIVCSALEYWYNPFYYSIKYTKKYLL